MFQRIKDLIDEYPRQYWLMIIGIVISTSGSSMIWPFILIYASGKLNMPLGDVATLISINAGTGILSSIIAGTLADKIGRKIVMNISLTINGAVYFFLLQANSYLAFAILMVILGLSNPLYQVGADAMLADMIPSAKRTDAYAINRIANNAAFALGPAIGGFLAAKSYNLAFYGATIGFLTYSLILFVLARETLDKPSHERFREKQETGGYGRVFGDSGYVAFVSLLSLGLIAPSMLWILLAVYTKDNFGLPENLYGWIPTTNAVMCVFVQYFVTRITRRHPDLPIIAIGMLIYAVGAGSVAFMTGFWGFWVSMVILTFGELTLVPTATKYVADRAPADMRGRYMSIYWLGWGLSRMLAPLIGGWLNDNVSPNAIWFGALALGLSSAVALSLLARRQANPAPETEFA